MEPMTITRDFRREATPRTPLISLAGKTLTIKGRSIPEDAIAFYTPLLESVHQWIDHGLITLIVVKLLYFNNSTSKCLLDLFKAFEKTNDVFIDWYYSEDDEDMLEAGEDYEAICRVRFRMRELSDQEYREIESNSIR